MKKLYMLSIAALLMAGCAEEVTTNNYNGQFITFSVADDTQTQSGESGGQPFTVASTRTTEFVPQNSLFTKEKSDNLQPIPVESDYEEQLYLTISTGDAFRGTTRGTENDFNALKKNGFGVYEATFFPSGGTATYSTGSSFTTSTSWSGNASTNHDFYAWYPSSGSGINRDGNKITYDMSGLSATATSDLLMAKTTEKYSTNNDNGQVALSFKHQLTPVLFQLSGVSGNIKKIKFSSLTTKAETVIGSNSWTSKTTGEYEHTVSSGDLGGSQYFMMIPQTIGSGTVITITVEDKQTSGKINHILKFTTTGAVTWAAGTPITYTISTGTITTMSVTYPKWNKVGGGTEDGPVTAYASGDKFGLYAVDKNNKIVYDNLQVPISSSDVTKLDLSTLTGAGKIFPSQYTYYLYYPYQATLTGAPTNDQTTYSTVAKNAAGRPTDSDAADTFFANVKSGWTPDANQSTEALLKAQDLQVSAVTTTGSATRAFSMAHQMGQVQITMGVTTSSIPETITYSGNTATILYTTSSSGTVTALNRFTGNIPYNYNRNTSYFIVKKGTSYAFSTPYRKADGTAQWTCSGINNTDITTAGKMKSISTSTPAFKNISRIYSYSGSSQTSGSAQEYTVSVSGATYQLEVWGACGCTTYDASLGGKNGHTGRGGYTIGTVTLDGSKNLYICCGGIGQYSGSGATSENTAGWNGGGTGQMGGGGCTHIALGNSNTLAAMGEATAKTCVLVVAGGGGAGEDASMGGCGGGTVGGDGFRHNTRFNSNSSLASYAYGGTQIAGGDGYTGDDISVKTASKGVFGRGGSDASAAGGGGGGWFGGGGASGDGAGAGGSGYLNEALGVEGTTMIGDYDVILGGVGLYANRTASKLIPVALTTATNSYTITYEAGHNTSGNARITILGD